ncbi:MAG: hypothetical protein U5L11_13925 [Arhodomonas sp.]|nr:hypothetical protein [Arhodomonas sp.]
MTNDLPYREATPADRMDALLERVSAYADRPHARVAAMVESLLTPEQWAELEGMVSGVRNAGKGRIE